MNWLNTSRQYPAAETERMMKLQDVLLKAMAKKDHLVTDRTIRRWRERWRPTAIRGWWTGAKASPATAGRRWQKRTRHRAELWFGDERCYDLIVILDDAASDERAQLRGCPVDQLSKDRKSSGKRMVRELQIGVHRRSSAAIFLLRWRARK
jgi:hypothetical protein